MQPLRSAPTSQAEMPGESKQVIAAHSSDQAPEQALGQASEKAPTHSVNSPLAFHTTLEQLNGKVASGDKAPQATEEGSEPQSELIADPLLSLTQNPSPAVARHSALMPTQSAQASNTQQNIAELSTPSASSQMLNSTQAAAVAPARVQAEIMASNQLLNDVSALLETTQAESNAQHNQAAPSHKTFDLKAISATNSAQATQSSQPAAWADLKLDASTSKWGEQMLQVLQDRVNLQASQQMNEARIRLDPPDLGKLDLVVRVEGDKLNVQINANNSAVRDALTQVSERLRADLEQHNFVNVNVDIGDQGHQTQQDIEQDEATFSTIKAANESNQTDATAQAAEHWLSTTA